MIHSAQRRDANERPIIDALRSAGVAVIQMPTGAGFDLLCVKDKQMFVVEVKAPGKYTLTPDEERVRNQLLWGALPYCVVQSVEDALMLWGLG